MWEDAGILAVDDAADFSSSFHTWHGSIGRGPDGVKVPSSCWFTVLVDRPHRAALYTVLDTLSLVPPQQRTEFGGRPIVSKSLRFPAHDNRLHNRRSQRCGCGVAKVRGIAKSTVSVQYLFLPACVVLPAEQTASTRTMSLPSASEGKVDAASALRNPAHVTVEGREDSTLVVCLPGSGTLSPMASTLPTIAASAIATDFHLTSSISPVLPVALYVLGLGIGPFYLAPLSELYGRRSVYIASFTIFGLLNVGCALSPNIAALAIFRFLSGVAGSAGPSLGGASIGDMFVKTERGKAQALYGFGPTGGPVLGGVLGGFILHGTGSWRWLMWVTAISPAVTVLVCLGFLRETYTPVLLRRRAKLLRVQYPTELFHTEYDNTNQKNVFALSITRPLRMLVTSPICASFAVYIGMVYGILYLFLLSLSLLFAPTKQSGLFTYGWTDGTSGLSFLGIGVGVVLGGFISAKLADRIYQWQNARLTKKKFANDSKDDPEVVRPTEVYPESRLFLLQVGMIVVPLGLIVYAWSAGRTHWIVPLLGAAIFATGMIIVYVAFQIYLVDIFGRFAASALATATILRSILGCVLTVVGTDLYERLNYDWGTMLLAFLCLAMLPLPLIFMKIGPQLRKKEVNF
nr:efflux pump rdc3 [Quercus suber]